MPISPILHSRSRKCTHPSPIPDQADTILSVLSSKSIDRILLIATQETIKPTFGEYIGNPSTAAVFRDCGSKSVFIKVFITGKKRIRQWELTYANLAGRVFGRHIYDHVLDTGGLSYLPMYSHQIFWPDG